MCQLCLFQYQTDSYQSAPEATFFSGSTSSFSNIMTALDSGLSWNTTNLTYSFNGDWGRSGTGYYGENVSHLDETSQAGVREIFDLFANVTNLTFTEVSGSDGDIAFRHGDLSNTDNVAGYAYYPDGSDIGGNVTFQTGGDYGTVQQGNGAYYIALHEIGHALGLQHPFIGSATTARSGGIPESELTTEFTMMAYNGSNQLLTPAVYDIYALQTIYGANTSYNAGDTVYQLDGDYSGFGTRSVIWDGGGNDTIDISNIQFGGTVDLREGGYTTLAGNDQINIAFNANIENARGSADYDTLQGNSLGNTLYGAGGNDTLRGENGNDTLYGGSSLSDATDGSDTLYGDGGDDIIYANSGNDTLFGGVGMIDANDGNDQLYGGLGDDYLYGNSGNDTLIGALGNDQLYGGLGDDVFVITPNGGTDVIWGFDGAGQAGGDVIQLYSNMNGTAIDTLAELQAVSFTDGTHSWMPTNAGGLLVLWTDFNQLTTDDVVFV